MHRTGIGPLAKYAAVEGMRIAAGRCIEGVARDGMVEKTGFVKNVETVEQAQRAVDVKSVGTAEQIFWLAIVGICSGESETGMR